MCPPRIIPLLLACVSLGACQRGHPPPPPPVVTPCLSCHGPGGHSQGAVPALAGMPAATFRRRMTAFRTQGETVMGRIVPAYSDAQIERMATYFANRPVKP